MHAPLEPDAPLRMAIRGAVITIGGVVLSGPVGLAAISLLHPPIAWRDTATFVRGYQPIDALPFAAGFGLVLGWVMLIAGAASMAPPAKRPHATVAVVFTGVFAALITFNYICQTAFIPGLVSGYRPEYDGIIAAFSMANPTSLSWGIEMWGYGCLGVATWFIAGVFGRSTVERVVAELMRGNAVVSVSSAILASTSRGWLLGLAGLVAYCIWNALILAIASLVIVVLRRRLVPA